MRAGHDHVVRVALPGLGDHVLGRRRRSRLTLANSRISRPAIAGQLGAERVGRVERRDAAGVAVAERDGRDALPVGRGGVALVEEQDADGAGGGGVLGLDLERAGAALDQRDVARREPGEVGRLAAAGRGVAEPELDVDRGDGGRDVARLGLRRRRRSRCPRRRSTGVGRGLLRAPTGRPPRRRRRRRSGG